MRLFSLMSMIALSCWGGMPCIRAEILFNSTPQGNQATIQGSQMIAGSGASAGVLLNEQIDQLSMIDGTVAVDGVDSIGIRVFGGMVEMSGGVVRGGTAGVRVQGGVFHFSGGSIRDGVEIVDPGSLFTMSGGGISNRNVTVSAGGTFSISGGTIFNSRVQAIGETSRVDVTGGTFSWLDAISGGMAHVFGTAFSINGIPIDFGAVSEYAVPASAGHMAVTYANESANSFKVVQSMGGNITLHLLIPGDFDGNSDLDGRDFLAWQRGESPNPLSAGDLADWQNNYGTGLLAATTVVPEPGAIVFCCLGLAAGSVNRQMKFSASIAGNCYARVKL
jgi:hypothetical protein